MDLETICISIKLLCKWSLIVSRHMDNSTKYFSYYIKLIYIYIEILFLRKSCSDEMMINKYKFTKTNRNWLHKLYTCILIFWIWAINWIPSWNICSKHQFCLVILFTKVWLLSICKNCIGQFCKTKHSEPLPEMNLKKI